MSNLPLKEIPQLTLNFVTKTFHLDRNMDEVKMAAVTPRFVYVSRRREDIVERAIQGEFLSMSFEVQDSPERSRKYHSYLVIRYFVDVDPSLAKELPGAHSARCFRQDGVPINRIVVTWSLLDPPPSIVAFTFLPRRPECELHRIKDDQLWCFRC